MKFVGFINDHHFSVNVAHVLLSKINLVYKLYCKEHVRVSDLLATANIMLLSFVGLDVDASVGVKCRKSRYVILVYLVVFQMP